MALTGVVGYVDGAAEEGDSGECCEDDRKLHSLNFNPKRLPFKGRRNKIKAAVMHIKKF